MAVLNKKAFKLPFAERDKFTLLVRLGVEYNREQRSYSIGNCNNIEKLVDAISSVLNEEVKFLQNCIVCGRDFPCQDCKYYELCTTKDLPFHCVCPQCLRGEKPEQKPPKVKGQGTLDLFG